MHETTGRVIRWSTALLGILGSAWLAAAERPNIVLILADDLGFSDTAPYGGEIATPNIARLADEGIRFSNYHTASSCAPTRAMLLTGVDSHLAGVPNIPEAIPPAQRSQRNYQGTLNREVVTVATLLQDAGYHTYMTGKWHLGHGPGQLPFYRGFERTVTMALTGSDNWQQKSYLPIYDDPHWYADGEPLTLPEDYYSSKYLVDQAISFIESNRVDGKPFFSYLPFLAVHLPVQAPRALTEKYLGRYDEGWSALRDERRGRAEALGIVASGVAMDAMASTGDWQALDPEQQRYQAKTMAVYAAMVEAMDLHIGRLMSYLQDIGEYDNTVFVFTSDNGAEPSQPIHGSGPLVSAYMRAWMARVGYDTAYETLGERGSFVEIGPSWASAAVAPLAYYKFYAGEGGMRVPLIIAGLPVSGRGGIARAFSYVTDIAPTVLQLADVSPPAARYGGRPVRAMSGRSLVPVLRNADARVHEADAPIGFELGGNAALFKGDYKLVRYGSPLGDDQWHLYDIVGDPGETRDLRAAEPALFVQLQEDYAVYARDNGVLEVPVGYQQQLQVAINGAQQGFRNGLIVLFLTLLVLLPLYVAFRLKSD
jgi:arylsulfatase A-like enzyme